MKTESSNPLNQQLNKQSGQNQKEAISLSNASHPIACIFTFIFKVIAFLVYFLIGNFFSDVNTFIIVVILSAIDFWTVKNVSGRLLLGLRWWSDFDQNGKEIWKFDSYDKQFEGNPVDRTFFWTSQIACALTWAAFLVLKILTISIFWALLCFINLSLCMTNLYGYYRCKGAHQNKIKELKGNMLMNGFKKVFS